MLALTHVTDLAPLSQAHAAAVSAATWQRTLVFSLHALSGLSTIGPERAQGPAR